VSAVLRKQVKNYLIELKMIGSSVHTLQNYGYHLDKFIAYIEENNLAYTELTPKQVKNFRNHLVEQGLKPRTINAILAALKSFYDPQRHHRAGQRRLHLSGAPRQRGISIDKVQDVLGHADITTTRRYARTAPEAIYELAAKVDELKERRAPSRFWLSHPGIIILG